MAANSKPSNRDGPSTLPAEPTRLGKRLRPHPEPQDERTNKWPRTDGPKVLRPKIPSRGDVAEVVIKDARGALPRLRVTSAVQPRLNGTATSPIANGRRGRHNLYVPSDSAGHSERRTLRSNDGGSRSRSELSLYFPNYEELVSIEPRETDPLDADTRLYVSEDPPKSPTATRRFVLASPTSSRPLQSPTTPTLKPPSSPTSYQTVRLNPTARVRGEALSDALFERAHHRAERQEKQLRNIEKERAQHEKVQLERLLEGLQGPDWLRVMGISGVVEGERKRWEDKRLFFVREVRTLIRKFRLWKEEERRRKLERDASIRGESEESASVSTDVDALAALQLHTETLSATAPEPPAPPPIEQPFTSFFAKPHQRAAALEKTRRSGRTRFAFGQPLPDMDEAEFQLPQEFITPQALKAGARSRRVQRRNTKGE